MSRLFLLLLPLPCIGAEPPGAGRCKLCPTETDKLTPADFPDPDGIVYPDCTYAGVPGGIPHAPVAAKIEIFGGHANDDQDNADALERGSEEVGKRGGAALLLGTGTYHLDRPVIITRDGVVLRGAGADKTKLIFRYAVPPGGVAFLQPQPNATVTRNTWIELHCHPKNLIGIEIRVGVEFADNLIYGGSPQQVRSVASLAIEHNTRCFPTADFNNSPPRPVPVVPSIFE